MPRFSPSGFFGSSKCLIPIPGLTTEYPICAVFVCVCAYTHKYTHIHSHLRYNIRMPHEFSDGGAKNAV